MQGEGRNAFALIPAFSRLTPEEGEEFMNQEKVPYRRMIFVCTNDDPDGDRPACGLQGSMAICKAIKEEVKRRGLKGKIRALKSGCMDLCEKGPNVMIWPEGTLHTHVTADDVPTLIAKYLI